MLRCRCLSFMSSSVLIGSDRGGRVRSGRSDRVRHEQSAPVFGTAVWVGSLVVALVAPLTLRLVAPCG